MAFFATKSLVEERNNTHKPRINKLSQKIIERLGRPDIEERLAGRQAGRQAGIGEKGKSQRNSKTRRVQKAGSV